MNRLLRCLIAVVCLSVVPIANAGLITARAVLTGTQEVPANASTAVGLAEIVLRTETNRLSLSANIGGGIELADISFSDGPLAFGVIGPMHIHVGAVGTNGDVVVPFADAASYTPADFGVQVLAVNVEYAPELLGELEAGNLYLNLHTLEYPGGEIRGQLAVVPEPATLGMLGAGLVALGAMRRRKRSA